MFTQFSLYIRGVMLTTVAAMALLGKGSVDIWPLERQDRYGTGQAIEGIAPDQYAPPWRHLEVGENNITSHGPSFDSQGNGYFGRWVNYTVKRFNAETGQITGTVPMGFHVDCTPAIGNGRIYAKQQTFNSQQGIIVGIGLSNLAIDWLNIHGYLVGSPTLGPEGDIVYVQEGGIVRRVNKDTGLDVWFKSGFGSPRGPILFLRDDSAVIVAHGNRVSALNWADGSTIWSYDSGFAAGRPGVAPDGTIVFGNSGNRIIGLNPNGTLKWTRFTTNEVDAAPGFGLNGEVYIGSRDWAVYAIDTATGAFLWNFLTNHWISQPPSVDINGRIYIQTRLGDIYCLSPQGNLIWTRKVGDDARGPMTFGPKGTLWVGYVASTSGLVSIRQDAPALNFTLKSVNSGINSTGDGDSLKLIDNNIMSLLSETSGTLQTAIEADFEGFVPKRQLDKLHMEMNVKLNSLYPIKFEVLVYNNTTNTWQSVPIQNRITANAQTMVLAFSAPPTQAVENGTNKVRVKLKMERYTRPTEQWGVIIDKLAGYVNPTF